MDHFIDTHTHIYLSEFDHDRDTVVQNAMERGVQKLCLPNVDKQTSTQLLNLAKNWPGYCLPMMGLHPTSVRPGFEKELEYLFRLFELHPMVAVGEIGIDLYWDKTYLTEQILAFRMQIEWALDMNLPVVIHSRNSIQEIIHVLESYRGSGLKGIMHCFPGNAEEADWFVGFGFLLGIGGVVTYKKSDMAGVVEHVDMNNIVLETDAPYLSPTPYRGKRNEPSYIVRIAEKVAELKGTTLAEVARITTSNALEIFQLKW